MINSRYFNSIQEYENVILKQSTNIDKISEEYNWYIKAIKYNNFYNLPIVYHYFENDKYAYYILEKIKGSTLSDLYINEALSTDDINKIFDYLLSIILVKRDDIINDPNILKYKRIFLNLYKEKTIGRLREALISFDDLITFNNIKFNLKEVIDDINIENIDDNFIGLVHGDLCFSNILIKNTDIFNVKNSIRNLEKNLYTIDPRGVDYLYGDIRYDIAKLMHSVIGNYDKIINNKFVINNNYNNYKFHILDIEFNIKSKQILEDLLIDKFGLANYIDFYKIMIHLFLSMIPLHKDNINHQKAFLCNSLQLYLNLKKLIIRLKNITNE